jgi:hypothetical protein
MVTGTLLLLATAAVVLWQNAHVAMLWDLAYLLDSSDRIALGQVPYRDFPFAHAPLTFLIQAASIHLFGRVYWHVIAYAMLTGATATLLTWRILSAVFFVVPEGNLRSGRTTTLATLLTLPLIFLGITSIYPHPIYDNDCILAILFALFCLQRTRPDTPIRNLLTGTALIPPLFFKQNIGLVFLAATIAAILTQLASGIWQSGNWKSNRSPPPPTPHPLRTDLTILLGATLTLAAALLAIHLTAGLHNYLHWTITFAAQQRTPSLGSMLSIYHQPALLWTLPTTLTALVFLHRSNTLRVAHSSRLYRDEWGTIAAAILLAAPLLYTLAALLWLDDPADRTDQLLALWPHLLILAAALLLYDLWKRRFTLTTLLPLILLATIHGTFLSQQLWGSNYAIWPLLLLLIACLLQRVPTLALPLAAIIAAVFLVNGSLYALSHERLSYSNLDGPPTRSTLPTLRGLTTPGPWLPALDELVRDTDRNLPQQDTLLLFPGQDPFYYATGRTPRFPVLLFDVATNPYSPQQLANAVREQNVRWLIVNRTLQLTAPPLTNYNDYLTALAPLFTLDHTLANYDIYRRR